MQKTIKELMATFYQTGTLERITVRSKHRGELTDSSEAEATVGVGLVGDHRSTRPANPTNKRQITLIQAEHLLTVASLLGQNAPIDLKLTRRNLLVSGINLLALKDKHFYVGAALLEYSGLCHPCSRMEENLGTGGYNAMRGHGGISARVIESGVLKVGDAIRPVND